MSTEEKDNMNIDENPNMDVNNTTEGQEVGTNEVSLEDQLKEELQAEKDKFLRMFAEFENFRKRTAKERIELFSTASEGVMSALLPVLDDFSRALTQMEGVVGEEHLTGFTLISNKFNDILSSKGLVKMEVRSGDVFNADLAEAVTQIPAGDEMKGKIVDVLEVGYKLGEKVIRYPKVVIGQ